MSKYTFTFKKNDIFVEFTTEDRDVVERQFQIWVSNADEYVKNRGSKPSTINPIDSQKPEKEEVRTQQKPPTPIIRTEEKFEASNLEEPKQEKPVFDKASNLLKTINSIQNEQNESLIAEEKEESVPSRAVDFESVLDQKLENSNFEPVKNKDPIFLNLINSKATTDKFHYLIITAYYLSEFDKLERFSLKQINAKLMQNLSEVIDHSILQEAINQCFVELIPDLTGMSEVGEYRLTSLGEEFFANKI